MANVIKIMTNVRLQAAYEAATSKIVVTAAIE